MGGPAQVESPSALMGGVGVGVVAADVHRARARAKAKRRPAWGPALVLAFIAIACVGINTAQWIGVPPDVLFLAGGAIVCAQLLMGSTRHLASAETRRAPTQFVAGSLLLVGAGIWSTLWVADPGASILIVARFLWLTLVWSWLMRSVTANRLAVDRLLLAFRVAVWISAVVAVAGNFGLVDFQDDNGRQMALTAHPNHLGGLLAIGLPFFVLDTHTSEREGKRPWHRSLPFRLVSSAFVVFALTTTGSMTALGSAICGVAATMAAQAVARGTPRRRHGPLVAIGVTFVVLLGVAGLVASGAPTIERFVDFTEGRSDVSRSVSGRGEQDSFVVDNLDRYLVMGIGFHQGQSEVEEQTGHYVHNNVLKLLYEAGVPAVMGLLVLWLLTARQAWRLLFNTRGTPLHPAVLALVGSFVAATLFAQFHPLAYERYYWFPLVMIGATWSLRRHELRASLR